jgi:hypothetical protein
MSWKVWKQPLERANEELQNGYRKGLNLSDWNTALSCFNLAFEFYSKAEDSTNAKLAKALASFSKALVSPQAVENWTDAADEISNTGLSEIDVTQTVPVKDLVQECRLKAMELSAKLSTNSLDKAAQLEEIAKQYMVFDGTSLLIPLLLEKQQTTGELKAHRVFAEAAQLRGNEEIDLDPKQASEFYRMAAMHLQAAGDVGASQILSGKADDSSATALCYFCGREVTGRGVNFVYMKAQLTRFIEKQNSNKVFPSSSNGMVVACLGCHSAITTAADEIAKTYYDKVEDELRAVEAEIAQVRRAAKL